MKIAVLGTGMVGNAIASKLVETGHQVMMGSRSANSEAGQAWLRSVAGKAQIGTLADAAAFGEIVFDCTNGANSLAALRQAGAGNLRGKIRYSRHRRRPACLCRPLCDSNHLHSGRDPVDRLSGWRHRHSRTRGQSTFLPHALPGLYCRAGLRRAFLARGPAACTHSFSALAIDVIHEGLRENSDFHFFS
jgi:hypothetical protein